MVFLVGAGPGDPGLLTLAGRDALAAADVVFYDALTHPALLEHCKSECEKVFVGKRAEKHFVKQEDTNALIAEAALAGKTVVRLKGGDPMVFGRGGEECQYLRERDIPFVVVPGITSAIAALTYAGIPITHRDAASSFAVITGHERGDRAESLNRDGGAAEGRRKWERIAHAADTLVFLMGIESLSENMARLTEHGRDPQTPVAVVQWGTWPQQRVATGTIATIADDVLRLGITAPAVTVVGEVVRYRESLRWFDNRLLWGQRIVVTRAREQASALSEKLRALGAEPVEFPTIRISPPEDGFAALDAAIERLSTFHWVVFTSVNGVRFFFERLAMAGKDARALGAAKVAAIGPATAEALEKHGIRADFVPDEYVAEKVLEQFPDPVAGQRILLPRATEAREVLPETWRSQGADVMVAPAYRTLPDATGAEELRQQLATGSIAAITFASSSTVTNFVEAVGTENVPESVRLVCIGPITAQTCRERLREPDAMADTYTLDGLIEALSGVQ
jgi:uroporphyrinogen III methyltransferase / synthase